MKGIVLRYYGEQSSLFTHKSTFLELTEQNSTEVRYKKNKQVNYNLITNL